MCLLRQDFCRTSPPYAIPNVKAKLPIMHSSQLHQMQWSPSA